MFSVVIAHVLKKKNEPKTRTFTGYQCQTILFSMRVCCGLKQAVYNHNFDKIVVLHNKVVILESQVGTTLPPGRLGTISLWRRRLQTQ